MGVHQQPPPDNSDTTTTTTNGRYWTFCTPCAALAGRCHYGHSTDKDLGTGGEMSLAQCPTVRAELAGHPALGEPELCPPHLAAPFRTRAVVPPLDAPQHRCGGCLEIPVPQALGITISGRGGRVFTFNQPPGRFPYSQTSGHWGEIIWFPQYRPRNPTRGARIQVATIPFSEACESRCGRDL